MTDTKTEVKEEVTKIEQVVEAPKEPVKEEAKVEPKVEPAEKKRYILHITSSDTLGLNLIENIVAMANLGATIKPKTLPAMRFPHSCSMILESDTPPTPSACIRVFDEATNKEIFKVFTQPTPASFVMETEETVVDKSTNDGKPWTKEQLDSMDWETEFKQVCKDAGISGRDRKKMTKEYISKYS